MSIEQNVARGKAVLEYLELGDELAREGGYELGKWWTAIAVGAADRAGIRKETPAIPRKVVKPASRLNDDSKMPFGKFQGERLVDVPTWYWYWFQRQPWCDEWPDLVKYANVIEEEQDGGFEE